MHDLIAPAPAGSLTIAEVAAARTFAMNEKALSTRRGYRTAVRVFTAWCHERALCPLPASPDTVAAFLATQATAGAKTGTIAYRAAAIRYAHRLAGLEPPTATEAVRATLRGIRRTLGTAQDRKIPATAASAPRRSRASATAQCRPWASPAPFDAPSWWHCRWKI